MPTADDKIIFCVLYICIIVRGRGVMREMSPIYIIISILHACVRSDIISRNARTLLFIFNY